MKKYWNRTGCSRNGGNDDRISAYGVRDTGDAGESASGYDRENGGDRFCALHNGNVHGSDGRDRLRSD